MSRFLLNGLPISLIYRHLKAISASFVVSRFLLHTIQYKRHKIHTQANFDFNPHKEILRGIFMRCSSYWCANAYEKFDKSRLGVKMHRCDREHPLSCCLFCDIPSKQLRPNRSFNGHMLLFAHWRYLSNAAVCL
jgi:hypothetical protein